MIIVLSSNTFHTRIVTRNMYGSRTFKDLGQSMKNLWNSLKIHGIHPKLLNNPSGSVLQGPRPGPGALPHTAGRIIEQLGEYVTYFPFMFSLFHQTQYKRDFNTYSALQPKWGFSCYRHRRNLSLVLYSSGPGSLNPIFRPRVPSKQVGGVFEIICGVCCIELAYGDG